MIVGERGVWAIPGSAQDSLLALFKVYSWFYAQVVFLAVLWLGWRILPQDKDFVGFKLKPMSGEGTSELQPWAQSK